MTIDSKDLIGHNGEETTDLWLIISKDLIGYENMKTKDDIYISGNDTCGSRDGRSECVEVPSD